MFQGIERTRILCSRSLCPWPLTYWPKLRGSSMSLANSETNYDFPKCNRLLSRHGFYASGNVTLTFNLMTPKSIGFIYGSWSTTCMTPIMVLLSGQWFYASNIHALDLWPMIPKSSVIICRPCPTKTPLMVSLSLICFKLLSEQWFSAQGGCDFNLWPTDKINWNHLWAMVIHVTKKIEWAKALLTPDRRPAGDTRHNRVRPKVHTGV